MKAPAADPSYHAVLILWPDAENFPVGGQIDFAEMFDAARQKTDSFLHYRAADQQISGAVTVDATQWHDWVVEWTPTKITAFVGGQAWWSTTDTSTFPPGPMHLTIQLDWFPGAAEGVVKPSRMDVDWVRFYPVDGSGASQAGNDCIAAGATAPTAGAASSGVDPSSSTATTGTQTQTQTQTIGPSTAGPPGNPPNRRVGRPRRPRPHLR